MNGGGRGRPRTRPSKRYARATRPNRFIGFLEFIGFIEFVKPNRPNKPNHQPPITPADRLACTKKWGIIQDRSDEPEESMAAEAIIIRGAREHNLKSIDLEIPRGKLVVITGVSGSGKSSLAFDTIYAEGQRRYVESLSAYARQFLEQMDKPDVDLIEGLSPAISIEQKTTSKNPRSTVATVTEIYDYLRLLFARVGKPTCYQCGKPITSQTVGQIVDQILNQPEGARFQILAPVVRRRKGEYRHIFAQMRREGYARARVNGRVRDLDEEIALDKHKKHTIEVVVDRLVIRPDLRRRLADSLETALRLGEGMVTVNVLGEQEKDHTFSERLACIDCGVSYPEVSPRIFSFNNPHGACTSCGGLGTALDARLEREGEADFLGASLQSLDRRYKFTESARVREQIETYVDRLSTLRPCPSCQGTRLRPESLAIKVAGLSIAAVTRLSVKEALRFFTEIHLSDKDQKFARRILKEIRERLGFLVNVGLDYLTLDRTAATLAGGEAQRIRLATQIGSSLVGVLYILDEPSIGLHQRDNRRLIETLLRLRDLGNTVIVVEHDEETMRSADYIVDLGPGAGEHGGEIVVSGPLESVLAEERSVTGQFLTGKRGIRPPCTRRQGRGWFVVRGAREHNLKNLDVAVPTGSLVCVTGVSGSGKSSLVN